jgi:hypothetical protein
MANGLGIETDLFRDGKQIPFGDDRKKGNATAKANAKSKCKCGVGELRHGEIIAVTWEQ